MLGTEARLGWILAFANLMLAAAMFAEPILFGRIIDTLANSQSRAAALDWHRLVLLLRALGGFLPFSLLSPPPLSPPPSPPSPPPPPLVETPQRGGGWA